MNNLVYGIDFGTTNSAIAFLNSNGVDFVTHGNDQKKIIPSVLFFPEGRKECYLGEEALSKYFGESMDGRLMQSIKSTLPLKWLQGTQINGKFRRIEDLVALILADLKRKADIQTGENVKKAVIGRPAVFSEDDEKEECAKTRLLLAAQKAGFEEIHFQIEPIAAALFYELSLTNSELVLVADFGGGTSDFTLMKLSPDNLQKNDRQADILGTSGVSIAGDKLDSAIMWNKLVKYFGADITWTTWEQKQPLGMPVHIMRSICDWRQIAFLRESKQRRNISKIGYLANDPDAVARLEALIDENLGFSLFRSIEKAKTGLSDKPEEIVDFHQSIIDISECITREEFNWMITPEIEAIDSCLEKFLSGLHIAKSEISSVFTTGGTAYVPRIKEFLKQKFGEEKMRPGDAFISVASGLALSSKLFFSE